MILLHDLSGWLAQAAAALPGGPAGLAALAAGVGALAGLLLARFSAGTAIPAATPPHPAECGESEAVAALKAELAAARATLGRHRQDIEAGARALSAGLAPVLAGLAATAEQGRAAAAERAGRAEVLGQAAVSVAEEGGAIAARLAELIRDAEALAGSAQHVAGLLAGIALALGPPEEGEQPARDGFSLVEAARTTAAAGAELAAALQAVKARAAEVEARAADVREAAEAAGSGAHTVAQLADAAADGAIAIGLDFVTFLDGLARAGSRRRFERYPTRLAGVLAAAGREWPVQVVGISRGGCAIAGDPGLVEGSRAGLRVAGLEETLEVSVTRRLGSLVGLAFVDADPLAGRLEALIVAPAEPPDRTLPAPAQTSDALMRSM